MSDQSAQNLRVVIVNSFSGPNIGRYGTRAIPLVKGLLAAGAQVGVVAAAGSGFAHAAIEAGAKVDAVAMGAFHMGRLKRSIHHMAWRMNANLVVGTSFFSNMLVRRGAPDSAHVVNIVSRIPSSAFDFSGGKVSFSPKELIGQTKRKYNDVYVALSAAVSDALVENGVPAEEIVVIPNGIDADAFVDAAVNLTGSGAPKMPEDDARLAGRPLVFAVARNLVESKGVDILEEVAARILRDWPTDTTIAAPNFRVAGTGPDKEALNAWLRKEAIADHFEIMGFAPQISRWYRVSDVVAMPSRSEAVAVVALEAMAHGKPVVAFETGGIPEVVADGETGILVPPEDKEAFAAALKELLLDPERARKMGEAGAARAREQFSEKKMLESYIKLFNELIG
ncbi:MAG: glycosyltransferase family 4 protein [Coriobacteriia bacterium]|nr:glycosyltransferase family 4 protein [Coriobacteriia bacterium]